MRSKIAVVIPFYQRQTGVLPRAVASVFEQRGDFRPLVIIVDDESPLPARTELVEHLQVYGEQILLVQQKNGGAAAARNTGLNHVPPDIPFVAFLDSDDEWMESHLSRAIWALEYGSDFYFSDFYQLNQTVTAFARAGRINVREHPSIHPSEPIHEYRSDMFDQILRGNILGTSTVVYNYQKFPDLRYPLGYRHTGEEYIFWLHLAQRSRRISFSSEPECRYGAGVNIFADSGWGTDKYLTIEQDQMKWRNYVLNAFPVSSGQISVIKNRIQESRANFATGLVHNLIHNWRVKWQILVDQINIDPLTFPAVFTTLIRIGLRKIKSRLAPLIAR
jgi:succinoglycan biosynthesis protein ExoW